MWISKQVFQTVFTYIYILSFCDGCHFVFAQARGQVIFTCINKYCSRLESPPPAQPCSGVIGYNNYTWYNGAGMYTGRQNGQVLKVSITKKRGDTLLRFAFNTNIHTAFARGGGRWSIYIDRRPCNRPAALTMMFYQDSARKTHQPALPEGIIMHSILKTCFVKVAILNDVRERA